MKIYLIVLFCFFTISSALAQQVDKSKSKKQEVARPEFDRGATYDTDIKKVKKKKKKKAKHSLNGEFDQKVEEYKERMEANAKKNAKMEKKLKKPQYSDPSYFGHKKKPKKRPVGKKKFCKECGMYH